MDRITVLGTEVTKRGLVVTLVTVAAVLGAGVGYVAPALFDPASPGDSGETGIETTVSAGETNAIGAVTTETDETTDTVGEATTEPQSRDGWNPPDRTTNQPETKVEDADRTTEHQEPTTSPGTDDDLERDASDGRDASNDREPSGEAESEVNVTVGSLSDYPSMSLTLNAVVNAPNTASTAGGA